MNWDDSGARGKLEGKYKLTPLGKKLHSDSDLHGMYISKRKEGNYVYIHIQYRSDARYKARVIYTRLHEEANALVH